MKYDLFLFLIIIGIIAIALQYYMKISFHFLRCIGLLRVIRDSEIEIYYLSKIKEYRSSIKCPNCGKRIPKDSIFCDQCGYEVK